MNTIGRRVIVLDAPVVLAFAFMEPGWDVVPWGREDLCISTVCLVEVATKLIDRRPKGADIQGFLDQLSLTAVPLTDKQALVAGLLRASTRGQGIVAGGSVLSGVGAGPGGGGDDGGSGLGGDGSGD